LVEHITDTDGVPGSNPGARTKKKKPEGLAFGFFLFGARGIEAELQFKDSKAGAGTMWSEANMVARRGRGSKIKKRSDYDFKNL
jgi:hypothetical protein